MNIQEILKEFNLSSTNLSLLNNFFNSLKENSFYTDLESFLKKENIPFSPVFIVKKLIQNNIIIAATTSHGINVFVFKNNYKKGFISLNAFSRLRTQGPEYFIQKLITLNKEETSEIMERKLSISSTVKKFISLSHQVNSSSIVECFKLLSLPFNNGSGLKEEFIIELLYEINIHAYYDQDIGIVVPSLGRKKKVVSSHIDLIPKFNKIFSKEFSCEVKKDILSGALDNTLTNTILLILDSHHKGITPKIVDYKYI